MTKQHPYQAQDSSKGGGFLAGIIVGGLIGAAAALLSSPKSGREVRNLIDERTAPARQRLTEQTQVVREKAEPLVGEWIQLAKDKAAPVIEKAKNNSTVQEAAQYAGFERRGLISSLTTVRRMRMETASPTASALLCSGGRRTSLPRTRRMARPTQV